MKHLKFLIFCFIIFIVPNVFAAEQNVSSKVKALYNYTNGTYYAVAPVAVPVPLYNSIGTRYNGTLSQISFYLNNNDWNWQYNKSYTITLNMATEDWRNHFMGPQVFKANSDGSIPSTNNSNMATSGVTFVSYKKIKFTFKTGNSMGAYTYFNIYSGNTTNLAFTGVSNYNLSSIIISDNTSSTPTPAPVTPTPSPTPQPNNQDIINNNTQNTNDIINNNNNNTQSIIDNQNQNNADVIENANQNTEIIDSSLNSTCKNGPLLLSSDYILDENKYLDINGNVLNDTNASISVYFVIKPNSDYKINVPGGLFGTAYSYCLYNNNKQVMSSGCKSITANSSGSGVNGFNSGPYAQYLRVTIAKNWFASMSIEGPICNNWEKEALDKQNQIASDTNNYLKDNSDPNISDNEFSSLFDSVSINDPLSSLLQLPVQFINAIVNQSNSCQVVNLGTLLGIPITLPCIDIGSILGSSVWNTIDILSSIGLIVLILKQLYESVTNALTLGGYMEAKKGGLGYMPPLEFLCDIITGFGGDNV